MSKILWFDLETSGLDPVKNGIIQFAALFDSLTVGENVAMGLRKQGQLTEDEIQARVHEALQLVERKTADRG